jgi:predicted nucleotidyltransferase
MATEVPSWGERALHELFGSEARARILAWLCSNPPLPLHGREIARRCGLDYTAAHRELSRLEGIGMLRAERVGRAVQYRLVDGFPLLEGLCQVTRRAVGVIPLLQAALADEAVDVAFVFGSMAAGTDQARSDADLLVIGGMDSLLLSDLCSEVEQTTGREISPVNYRPDEFRRMLAEGSSFLAAVMRGPKTFVKGDEDVLRQLAGDRTHPGPGPAAG